MCRTISSFVFALAVAGAAGTAEANAAVKVITIT